MRLLCLWNMWRLVRKFSIEKANCIYQKENDINIQREHDARSHTLFPCLLRLRIAILCWIPYVPNILREVWCILHLNLGGCIQAALHLYQVPELEATTKVEALPYQKGSAKCSKVKKDYQQNSFNRTTSTCSQKLQAYK